ncbi:MAG: chromosome segregation protein SMC [Actinomycetota bacterium]
MFLKSLEIRGFKSFAERTVLEFAPGVSVIVGPNGSGKSNLVDAIAWVLGEQGPKTLRGGKMEDVIFAGTPKKPGAGRAEVALTIDNSSGILPIEFTEVTIRRTLFRNGDSEYAINDVTCRLLDVQELLSDTGVGRELHTIVGQGQLDEILNARPEDRRAYIEEAAGILKHRRRKERAIRKLERVDADIERIGDLISELRRQIRPLERQAEVAKRASEIEGELKEVRLAVWAADYSAVVSEADVDAERRLSEELDALSAQVSALEVRGEEIEDGSARASRDAQEALGAEYRLASLRERFVGLARLAEERGRHLSDLADRAPEGEAPGEEMIAAARRALEEAASERASIERDARTAEEEWARAAGAREEAARAREAVVHLHGERAALRAAVEAAEDERRHIADQQAALTEASRRRATEISAVKEEIEVLDTRETSLGRSLEELEISAREREVSAATADDRVRELERDVEKLETRRAILRSELERAGTAGAADLIDRERFPGLLGRIAELVRPAPGFERALAAALEPYTGALLARSLDDAAAAIGRLKAMGSRAAFIVTGRQIARALPPGVRSAIEAAKPTAGRDIPPALVAILSSVGLVDTLDDALALARAHRDLVIVTREGDRVASDLVAGGAEAEPRGDLAVDVASIDERLQVVSSDLEGATKEAWSARALAEASIGEVNALTGQMNELDALITGAVERLAHLEREEHAADREQAVLAGRSVEVEERLAVDSEKLGAVEAQLGRAMGVDHTFDAAALATMERRAAENALRLGGMRERERAARSALEELEARAARVRVAMETWEASRAERASAALRSQEIARAAATVESRMDGWLSEARAERQRRESERAGLEEELGSVRRYRRQAESRLEELRETAHRSDLARAERSHRISSLVERLRADQDLAPDEAMQRVGEPPTGEALEELRRRAATLDRKLGLLGRVNPIAMEQYQGMVDRHAFLSEQVEDLRKSRRDLVSVVGEVDRKIVEIFGGAFSDVSRQFEEVFLRLFPGGEGRLTLTQPDDLLESGVEIEARPGGKRVKRISLLSGGERALTAIALLSSIFRARPSPFYLLDEVEAALDDVNLHRFLELAKEFKNASQILIVTHQKRTMEIADALYGISMGGDGVTRVLSERLEENEPVGA